MKYFASLSLAAALLFTGCSSKQYFEPEQTYSASNVTSAYDAKIVTLSRDGASLDTGGYIGKKEGIQALNLTEGYRYLSENSQYVLASNSNSSLKVWNKSTKKEIRDITFDAPVVSAAIRSGTIAYILNDNSFGLYSIHSNQKIFESQSEQTYAIDIRAASPMFIDSLTVFPMLDGKIVVVNGSDLLNAKVVYISSESAFNNVIYLARSGNTMIAATPGTLITLGSAGEREYRANISEVALSSGMIYLFTKEGEIIKLNTALEPLKETKFKFAHFSAATAFGGKVFALDQQGSLIVMDSTLSKSRIYDVGKVEDPAFISGSKLYKDGDVIELSKLGYE